MIKGVSISALRRQFFAALLMLFVAAIALGASTYAWFVSRNKVTASGSTLAVQSTENVLFITDGKTAGGERTDVNVSLNTVLFPASSDNMTDWWVMDKCDTDLKVLSYRKPTIVKPLTGAGAGIYDTDCNAYCLATYNIFTVYGKADLYLNGSVASPITVTGGSGKFPDAARIGVVVGDTLKFVYAPANETGSGNDKDALPGFRTVANASSTKNVGHTVFYADQYSAADGKSYTAHKVSSGSDVFEPDPDAISLATQVGKTGVVVELYIWLEGTDSDCFTDNFLLSDDFWNVTVNFAGVTAN